MKKDRTNEKKPKKTARKKPEILKLDRISLLELEKSQAEIRANQAEFILAQFQHKVLLKELDPEGKLDNMLKRLQELSTSLGLAQEKHRSVAGRVEKSLGINLKDYSYDDLTGILYKHDEKSDN